jgi:hypothetical protein
MKRVNVVLTDEAHAILKAEQEAQSRLEGASVRLGCILSELLLHLGTARARRAASDPGNEVKPS